MIARKDRFEPNKPIQVTHLTPAQKKKKKALIESLFVFGSFESEDQKQQCRDHRGDEHRYPKRSSYFHDKKFLQIINLKTNPRRQGARNPPPLRFNLSESEDQKQQCRDHCGDQSNYYLHQIYILSFLKNFLVYLIIALEKYFVNLRLQNRGYTTRPPPLRPECSRRSQARSPS